MKLFTIFLTAVIGSAALAQDEAEFSMTQNTALAGGQKKPLKINAGTFDSTFIYTTDTISMPFFDDFSKNHIQKYNAGFSDPGVTFDKKFRLTDASDVALPEDAVYTTQVTFRRTYNTTTGITTDVNFAPLSIKVGNLATYPVVYQTTDVYPPYYIFDTTGVVDVPDTIFVVGPSIFQDSATQFFAQATGQNYFWLDDQAYHNYRYAVDPWSLGVMTFDGLDNSGYPYAIGTTLTDYADHLTTKPIDLSGSLLSDSIYLTFLVQKQGFGDAPEAGDSLILEFYNSNTQQWSRQWSVNGGTQGEFILGQVPMNNAAYLTDAFQFRFKNYGAISGALDHFHLDYVKFRNASGFQDTLIEDFAMVYPIATLLNDYTAVPWDHYQNNSAGKMSTNTEVVVRNSYLNGGANISSAGGGKIEVYYGAGLEGNVPLNGQTLAGFPSQGPDYTPRTTYHSNHDVSAYSFDPLKPGTQQSFDIETIVSVPVGSNYLPNDTARSAQFFSNYYSYDDGTAEQAYGPQGIQSMLAIQYTPYEADSIIGMMVHFVPTVNDVSNNLFQLAIWGDNGGVPGSILYEDDAFFARQPIYEIFPNKFVKYFTQDTLKIPVTGTFYIGWKQIDEERLGVGLDKNIDNKQHTFYNVDGSWQSSSISGSVMIRPIFSTSLDPELGVISRKIEEPMISIYPNPSNGVFHLHSDSQELGEILVYSIQGEQVLKTTERVVDLSNHPNGMYFVKVENSSHTYKIIKGQ